MFDFDATLPLMALQFLVLTVVLNAIFYKPLTKTLDERDEYIRNQESDAKERLSKAEKMAKEYEEQLGQARKQSQAVIAAAQEDARKMAAQAIAEAQQEAQAERAKAQEEIDQQKQQAMASLEQQVDDLSSQILEKLLGPALVR
ncbi:MULTISPECIES: F0F1 ATP synthase subunit B' [Moorena]|uniref:ATP synthase subunit b' n=2 Tax=Moorena producens TaxID=1155739 RepID=A0A1D9FXM8_MOOP1|nr:MULTISPECIES: F0F1 ATP synthase subunit B' [Moorena]NEQ12505.1 F0F1 ATP synthase subunit B' [Moorena sp. SIO3E2]NES84972.1 F0F1 ATP synthase subunit B' [Moorena sp. SIO2B7]AOY80127.1 F0F1 ATP synthase subunit B' [Moorena producens JHB]EGJ34040.1 ATP synthase F0 subcomplex B' subunit [Moorena producens 3L]NEP30064.1 F0F1 ATP synthase subunit B' [Moorena sp. SIO3B2]